MVCGLRALTRLEFYTAVEMNELEQSTTSEIELNNKGKRLDSEDYLL